jgi:aminoglycoside phosphotransferase (APT) family kinase protein
MTDYAPLPTDDQLRILSEELGQPARFDYRIVGGLGGTVDVLELANPGRDRVVLKRYWLPESEEINPAESEFRALALAAQYGIAAPEPLWVDRKELFPERAIVASFIEGKVLLEPGNDLDWAAQLATALYAIHGIRPAPSDRDLFPRLCTDDGHRSESETLEDVNGHPLGMKLWTKVTEIRSSFQPEAPVYVHHDFWPGNTLWVGEDLVAVVDWEGGCVADPALDVAYCAFDIRLLGLSRAASHFVDTYRELSGRSLPNLGYWDLVALCRPLPDIAMWLPGWEAMGLEITADEARRRHSALITAALDGSTG